MFSVPTASATALKLSGPDFRIARKSALSPSSFFADRARRDLDVAEGGSELAAKREDGGAGGGDRREDPGDENPPDDLCPFAEAFEAVAQAIDTLRRLAEAAEYGAYLDNGHDVRSLLFRARPSRDNFRSSE